MTRRYVTQQLTRGWMLSELEYLGGEWQEVGSFACVDAEDACAVQLERMNRPRPHIEAARRNGVLAERAEDRAEDAAE